MILSTKPFRIVHLSSSDTQGGAALASLGIHRELIRRGVDSTMYVGKKTSGDPSVFEIPVPKETFSGYSGRLLGRAFSKAFRNRHYRPGNTYSYLSSAGSKYRFDPNAFQFADLIQLNWVADFLHWRSFFNQRPKIPLVWRLADMAPFTGLCHYSEDCDLFKSACRHCPQARSGAVKDSSKQSFRLKRRLLGKLEDEDLTLICQSAWMAEQVSTSSLFSRFSRRIIRNGVDESVFFPIEKEIARRALGLNLTRPIVLLCGFSGELRKGFSQILESLINNTLDKRNFLILGPAPWSRLCFEGWKTIKATDDRQILRMIYSAADFLVFPAIQDNCPNTVIESIACGTPVLAFDGSGAEEIIEVSQGGWLATCRDFNAMAQKIFELISNEAEIRRVQSQCVKGIKNSFKYEKMILSYLEVYQEVLNKRLK